MPPIIIPTAYMLRHGHRVEFPTWCADKLREAIELGPRPAGDGQDRMDAHRAANPR